MHTEKSDTYGMQEPLIQSTDTPDETLPNLANVAIVGRANVGKSSLFNRFVGKRVSIVRPEPGTTIDRVSHIVKWEKTLIKFYDTGGFTFSKDRAFADEINREIFKALGQADLILFVCDGQTGIHPQDELFAEHLRGFKKRVALIVNKIDDLTQASNADEFYKLGYPQLFKVSATHAINTADLLDWIGKRLPVTSGTQNVTFDLSLAIVGEPNSGKSTFFNALLNQERSVVSDIPGTTRDVIAEVLTYKSKRFLIQDTAGIRKSDKKAAAIQKFSIQRTRDAIRRSEVVMLICDATRGISGTTKHIASFILDERKACIVIINKWDLIIKAEQSKYEAALKNRAPFLREYPFVFISAKYKNNLFRPFDTCAKIYETHTKNIKTSDLNELLAKIKRRGVIKEDVRLKFLLQIKTAPPHFLLIGRRLRELKDATRTFIKNQIEDTFKLHGTPIQLSFKEEERE